MHLLRVHHLRGPCPFRLLDFKNEHRSLNIRNTLFTLVDEGVVPIINENDSVSFDEIKIGDNDNLSALTAILWSADLLILFSDIDGVYSDNPKTNHSCFFRCAGCRSFYNKGMGAQKGCSLPPGSLLYWAG